MAMMILVIALFASLAVTSSRPSGRRSKLQSVGVLNSCDRPVMSLHLLA